LDNWKSLRISFYYDNKYRIQNMDVRGKKMVDEMYTVRERTRESVRKVTDRRDFFDEK